jgi:hypothetical protein
MEDILKDEQLIEIISSLFDKINILDNDLIRVFGMHIDLGKMRSELKKMGFDLVCLNCKITQGEAKNTNILNIVADYYIELLEKYNVLFNKKTNKNEKFYNFIKFMIHVINKESETIINYSIRRNSEYIDELRKYLYYYQCFTQYNLITNKDIKNVLLILEKLEKLYDYNFNYKSSFFEMCKKYVNDFDYE